MFSSRKARNKRSFTTVQIVSGQLLSASVNPEQSVDISRILAAANKRCSAYCQRLPKGSATMPVLAGMIYNIQLIRFTIYTIPCNGQFVYVFSTTSFLSYELIFPIISFLPKILSNPIFSNRRFAFSLVAWFAFSLSIALRIDIFSKSIYAFFGSINTFSGSTNTSFSGTL